MKGKKFLWKINKDYTIGDTSDISTTTCNSKRSQDTAIEVVGKWLVSTVSAYEDDTWSAKYSSLEYR